MNKILTPEEVDERVAKGVALFKEGYNCSQSVVGAYADLYDIPHDFAMHMSASFGGGIGRMRLTCGTVSGMIMLAGFENGCIMPAAPKERSINYALVQRLAHEFRMTNGSITCADLLGLRTGKPDIPVPSERTAEYYKNRPCIKMVESACRIFGNYILEAQSQDKPKTFIRP